MNNDKRTTRELAIVWWEGLTHSLERDNLNKKYFPFSSLASITYPNIEHIYLSEHPEEKEPLKKWWNNLSSLQKQEIAKRHFPNIVKSIGVEKTVNEVPLSFLKQIHQIEMSFLTEHPTETESKKEEGKEGDILEGIDEDFIKKCLRVSNCSTQAEDMVYRLISLAPQLAKENKELKDNNGYLLRNINSISEANKSLREANQRLKEALIEMMKGSEENPNVPGDWWQRMTPTTDSLKKAKQALNQ